MNKEWRYKELDEIDKMVKEQIQDISSQINVKIINSTKQNVIIQYKGDKYKDLSPGQRKNHNIDFSLKSSPVILKRWKEISNVLM
jgi:hypothetical protein